MTGTLTIVVTFHFQYVLRTWRSFASLLAFFSVFYKWLNPIQVWRATARHTVTRMKQRNEVNRRVNEKELKYERYKLTPNVKQFRSLKKFFKQGIPESSCLKKKAVEWWLQSHAIKQNNEQKGVHLPRE